MDLHSGLPYFWIRSGLPFDYPVLTNDVDCEVLVVGGGITGALCAHACATAGLDVLVIDARAIGTGSTSASTALLQYELDTPLHVLARKIGLEDAVRSYRLCAQAVEEILELAATWPACHAHPRRSVQFASRRGHVKDLKEEQALRAAHGFYVDLLSRRELEAMFGFSKPAALMSHLAAEIDPYAFTHALLQDTIARGARVYERTLMEGQKRTGTGFRLRANECTIEARHLIMATGYESQEQLASPVLELRSTYAVASERIDREELWNGDYLIWETSDPYHYLRTTPDRRVIMGGLDEPFRDPQRRDALLERKTARLVKDFQGLFPSLPFKPEYQWCGTFGSTHDGLPFIDRDERTGAWYVLGMGGNGIVFSQVGANIVRDMITGRTNTDARLFRFDRRTR